MFDNSPPSQRVGCTDEVDALSGTLGIRCEDKSRWERRVPLVPAQVERLRAEHGVAVVVQPSENRVFPAVEFAAAGARVDEDLSGCDIVIGVKEIPIASFEPRKPYMFFAHVIKGQPHNMPMLRRMLDLGCTLIDYERVIDADGRRLIAFGRFAGLAGMTDALWALGRRLEWEGIANPFAAIRRTIEYADLGAAKAAIRAVGRQIESDGLPAALPPLVCGFAGYGNVSQGAQEIFDLLPVTSIDPEELETQLEAATDSRRLYKVVFEEEHLVEPMPGGMGFELQDYYAHPEKYRSRFERFLPHLTLLMNCIYWDARYPRLVTKAYLRNAYGQATPGGAGSPRLRVIGDLSCDVGGAIEATVRATTPGDPVYVYDPPSERALDGWEGRGPVILAVDILPSELPVESSESFGEVLAPFVPALVAADYEADFESLALPLELKRAVVAHRGELTPEYRYITKHLESNGG